jgi:hypothetical protein
VLVAPLNREPGADGWQVVLQPPREAGQRVDAAVHRLGHPRLQVMAPTLPHERQKGLTQLTRPRDACIHLTELVQIRLGLA